MSNRGFNGKGEVKVFIGTSPNGEDAEACAVCEHSIRSRTKANVHIEFMRLSSDQSSPYGGWLTERWSTPWSVFRWVIPELCKWRGRALYFDCPTIVLGDVADLNASIFNPLSCVLLNKEAHALHTSCLVWNCAAAKKWIPSIAHLKKDIGAHQTVGNILATKRRLVGKLPEGWGAHDLDYSNYPEYVTGSVHCANRHMQPHVAHAISRLFKQGRHHWFKGTRLPHYCNDLVALFERELASALIEGYEPRRYDFSGGVRELEYKILESDPLRLARPDV